MIVFVADVVVVAIIFVVVVCCCCCDGSVSGLLDPLRDCIQFQSFLPGSKCTSKCSKQLPLTS